MSEFESETGLRSPFASDRNDTKSDNITESDHGNNGKAILIALNINFFDARERKIINFKLVRRIKKVVKIIFRERRTKRVQLDGSRRA